jgi:hypothetical protein
MKSAGEFIQTFRQQPLVLMLGLMNIVLLVFLFYYLSRITARTETTVHALFESQDKLFTQWGTIVKDQNALTERVMHCILPEDAIKLMQAPPHQ